MTKKIFLTLSVMLALGILFSCEQMTTSQADVATPAKTDTEVAPPEEAQPNPNDARTLRTIFDHCMENGQTYGLLEHICKNIGPRLSGSPAAAEAVEWTHMLMESYGFDRVYLQDVMVPHWVRGEKEVCRMVGLADGELNLLAIGGSVATPPEGILAEVVQVTSFDELREMGEKVRGRIVFLNRPFDQSSIRTGTGYGSAVDQRVHGASQAALLGARAVVIRSVSSAFDDVPHTGTLDYADSLAKIPAAALGVQSADRLTAALAAHPGLKLFLQMSCQNLPDAPSHNVVGELRGSEYPDSIILVGGHLDSWDVGEGAHDDGAGCMQAIQVLRTFQELGIQPRHTIRAVMFMNEENGTRGGKAYATLAKQLGEKHIVAIESDAGGFSPRGFGLTGSAEMLEKWKRWLPLFDPHSIAFFESGGGGVDIGPLYQETGTPMAGLSTDSQRMFDLHHSANDTFESVNRRELELGTASMAALVYLIDLYGK